MNRADFLLKAETWLNDPGFYASHGGPAEILVREALELLKKDEPRTITREMLESAVGSMF